MTKPIYIIYKHTCTITGKSYIGQTCQTFKRRWNTHVAYANRNSQFHFHRAIKKHGKENFTHEILFIAYTQNMSNDAEIFFVTYYDTFNNGYNMTEGGKSMSGFRHSEETKEKIRQHHSNNPPSKEYLEKLSQKRIGKKNPNWKGWYHTPWDIYESSRLAAASNILISIKAIWKWCNDPDKIISKACFAASPYLKSLKESPLGKTFRDIRFWFEPAHSF